MEQRRIYISGKITGNKNYLEDFSKAEEFLKTEWPEAVVFNPAKIGEALPPLTHDEYMRFSFLQIVLSDAVFMLPNWEDSKGACMEYGYAKALDIPIFYAKNCTNYDKSEKKAKGK